MTIKEKAFEYFWNAYDKKVGKNMAFKLWMRLSIEDMRAAYKYLAPYKESKPEKIFRKDPERYIRHRVWEDELLNKDKASVWDQI